MLMRAAVLREEQIQVREIPIPTPGSGQILVKTHACGICASDIHFMERPDQVMAQGGGLWNYDRNADMVMGHEFCAEIVDYGPATERKWKPGTRVSSTPVLINPDAIRITGYSPDALGGFGEYFLMSEAITQVVKTDLPSELVATSDAMAVGWFYVKKAAMTAREIPLVIGCGAIGLSVIAALKRRGIGPIIAADFGEARRHTAKLMGADIVIDPAAMSPYAAWRELAYGEPDKVRGIFDQVDLPRCVAFECVGIGGVLDGIIMNCERDTRILSAGGCPDGDHIHSVTAHTKGLNIQFGGGPMLPDWNEAMEEVCSGNIDVRPIVGEVIGVDGIPEALRRAKGASAPPRIIVSYQ
jgi:threonine dehydrogenase-like Zn-dependent dehydrogenase